MVYNESMPKVSVLMPCFNAAATVGETLESIAAQ
jgi:glycosyltransferase involved in cell wall biosynthesis